MTDTVSQIYGNIISLENLSKAMGKQAILKNINIKIPRNSITTILGFSGAGKTTLLKIILGLIRPTSGRVKVLGQDISTLSAFALREFRKNFGMLFQNAALFDSITAFDNVAFPLRELSDMPPPEIFSSVRDLLLAVGIQEESFYKYPSQLSGGMRKRVGLARALALGPQIMLYDEPTTGLDPITTKMVNDLIVDTASRHKKRGLTTIIISHDVRASLLISDYIAFLKGGEIVEYSKAEDFKNSANPLVQEFINL